MYCGVKEYRCNAICKYTCSCSFNCLSYIIKFNEPVISCLVWFCVKLYNNRVGVVGKKYKFVEL